MRQPRFREFSKLPEWISAAGREGADRIEESGNTLHAVKGRRNIGYFNLEVVYGVLRIERTEVKHNPRTPTQTKEFHNLDEWSAEARRRGATGMIYERHPDYDSLLAMNRRGVLFGYWVGRDRHGVVYGRPTKREQYLR